MSVAAASNGPGPIEAAHAAVQGRLDGLSPERASRRPFLETYLRTTAAVGVAIEQGVFEDAAWVELWSVAFAGFYLDALDADLISDGGVARPWRLAFDASADLADVQHVLLGINAHINLDLPQALLEVISDDDFTDPALMDRRRRDHERIDGILSGRVAAEDRELSARTTRRVQDRLLRPANRWASRHFLREARQKVWHNTAELQRARLAGPDVYETRRAELELLSAAKIADLLAPGPVLLRLAVAGFGVVLPPPA